MLTPPEPEFEDDEPVDPVNVFCPWEGRNFRLKITKVEGFSNFDKSKFEDKATAIADSDEKIEAIWKQCHSLTKIIAPEQFKSYEELEKKLNFVLGKGAGKQQSKSASETDLSEDDENFISRTATTTAKQTKKPAPEPEENSEDDSPFKDDEPAPAPKQAKKAKPAPAPAAEDDDDADLDYFKKLAQD
jgi:hypothetical protein